ncbi:MAG TPA: OadG-related small transporter subunit [Ferruginibacter sp.]|nr:OadG-related small transporter subunit [Ferruginibacter sp.]
MDPLNAALTVTGLGMAGIFIFMFIFYLSIRIIDKLFPGENGKKP